MRTLNFQLFRWLNLIFALLILLALTSCKVLKKSVRDTKRIDYAKTVNARSEKETLQTDYFGDTLSGSMNVADSTKSDSATFESAGIKLKIKVIGNGKGGRKIDFSAEAKPVARSKLTSEKADNKLEEKLSVKTKQETKETTKTSPGGWGWLIAIIIIAIVILLVRRALKF